MRLVNEERNSKNPSFKNHHEEKVGKKGGKQQARIARK